MSHSCRATEWPFWFGLVLPFAVIYAFNWTVFIIIMIQLLRRRSINNDNNVDRNKMGKVIKSNLIIAAGLSLLFGLGWGFGLTATSSDVKELTFAFQLIFSVFVGSQGVLIFIFYGIRSSHFRQVFAVALGLKHRRRGLSKNLHKTTTKEGSDQYSQSTMAVSSRQPYENLKSQLKESYLSEYTESIAEMAEVVNIHRNTESGAVMSTMSSPTDTAPTSDEQL